MKKKTFIVQMLDSKNPSKKSYTQVEDALFYSNDTDAYLAFLPHEQEGFEFNEAIVALYNTDDESLIERPAVVETFEGRKSVVLKMTEDILAHWGRWQAQVVFKQGDKINTSVVVKFDTLRYMLDQRPPTLRDVIKVDELYSQLVTVMDEIADKDVISAPEIILARGGLDTLGDRLDASDNELSSASSEIAGARGGENTLGERLDKEHNEVTTQLTQTQTQLEGLEVNVTTVGVYPNDEIDHTETLRQLIATGVIPVFPSGRYIITDELLFTHGQAIRCVGKVTFDGTNFVGTNGKEVVRVTNEGDNYISLPSVATDLNKGDIEITFVAPHGLELDDIVCLYDNTDFSWSSARDYYKKGEFCRVASIISDTKILLDNPLFDGYDATTNLNFGAYKMNMGGFNVYGNLEIIQGKQGTYGGLLLERVKDFKSDNIISYAKNGSIRAVRFWQCYNIEFNGTAIQEKESGLGLDYGLAISNSQHIRAKGYFSANRHGVTHGGSTGVGCVINRDSVITGTVKTHNKSNIHAFDCHGNSEHIYFNGVAYGGVTPGGASFKMDGVVYGNTEGVCVQFSEVKEFNHDFSGVQFITDKNPDKSNRGVIDFGGNTTSDVNHMLGGTMNFADIKINAPNAMTGLLFRLRSENHLTNEKKNINLQNADITTSTAIGSNAYRFLIASVADDMFNRVNASGVNYNSDTRTVTRTEQLTLENQKGNGSYTTPLDSKEIKVEVSFDKPYPSNYTPTVNLNGIRHAIGSSRLISRITSVNNTGFVFYVNTMDGTNFSSSMTNNFHWTAE